MSNSLRIILIDDHALRAAGLSSILSERCFGSSDTIIQKHPADILSGQLNDLMPETSACIYNVGAVPIHDPYVLVIVRYCLEALAGQPLILMSDHLDTPSIQTAIDLGVHGVVPTEMSLQVAVAAIQFILAGGHYYPHSVSPPLGSARQGYPVGPVGVRTPEIAIRSKHKDPQCLGANTTSLPDPRRGADLHIGFKFKDRRVDLTQRQFDVLMSLEKGLTNKAIGRELDLSEATVKVHVRHLMRKLGATNRTQIALLVSSARNAGDAPGRDALPAASHDPMPASYHVVT